MAATIPATNKWLLTKQVSVAQSAERWQAGDGMEAEAGGPPGSSLAEFLCKLVVQGLRQHRQAEEAVGAQRKMKAAEMEKRKREPETRLVRGWGCGWVSANAWTVQKRLGTLALWSRCLSCLYHTACLLSSAWLTATLSKPGKPKSERMMLGTFGEPRPPAAKGHLWMIFHLHCASPLCF